MGMGEAFYLAHNGIILLNKLYFFSVCDEFLSLSVILFD